MSFSEFHVLTVYIKLLLSYDLIHTSHYLVQCYFWFFLQDGKTMVESKTADLRYQIRRRGNGPEDINQASEMRNPWQQSDQTQSPSRHETQLKASRDVRCQLCNHV